MKNAFKNFKLWSSTYWWIYFIVSLVPWVLIYRDLFSKPYSMTIQIALLVFQLTGLILLILSGVFTSKGIG